MRKLRIILLFLISISIGSILFASEPIKGRLANGLGYIIHPTEDGSGTAEVRLVIHIGSCVEEDNERGYAHFLEHLAFSGSKHFPEHQMVEWTEGLGIRYGIGLNAQTTHSHTMYMITLPQTEDSVLDSTLLILRDWIDDLALSDEAIENERSIVKEEIRAWYQEDPFYDLKVGQGLHSRRMPLGTMEDIEHIDPKRIRAFYRKWYRPELATVILVGDLRADTTLAVLKQRLGTIEGTRDMPRPLEPDLEYPADARIANRWDDLTSMSNVTYIIPHPTLPKRSVSEIFEAAKEHMAFMAWKNRSFQIPRTTLSDSWYLAHTDHLALNAEADSIPIVIERMRSVGEAHASIAGGDAISDDEMDELIREEKAYNPMIEHDDREGLIAYYIDEALHGDYALVRPSDVDSLYRMLDGVRPVDLRPYFDRFAELLVSKDALLAYTTPQRDSSGEQIKEKIRSAIAQGLIEPAKTYNYEPLTESENTGIVKTPTVLTGAITPMARRITKRNDIQSLGVTEIYLTNGIHILLKPTMAQDSIVKVSISVPGGQATIAPTEETQLESLAGYIEMGMIERAPREELSEYMMNKEMALSIIPGTYSYGLMGTSKRDELTELLRLIKEKMLRPEIPYEDMEEVKQEMLTEDTDVPDRLSRMIDRDPMRKIQNTIDQAMAQYIPLRSPETREEIMDLDIEKMAMAHRDRLSRTEGMDITIVGPSDLDDTIDVITDIFGEMPRRAQMEIRRTIPDPIQAQDCTIINEDSSDRADLCNIFVNRYTPSLSAHLKLKLTRELLRNRLIDKLRTEAGIVYSPALSVYYRPYPIPSAYFVLETTLAEENIDRANALIGEIIQDLLTHPVEPREIEEIRRTFLTNKEASLTPDNTEGWQKLLNTLIQDGESIEDFAKYEQILKGIDATELWRFHQDFFSDARHLKYRIIPKLIN